MGGFLKVVGLCSLCRERSWQAQRTEAWGPPVSGGQRKKQRVVAANEAELRHPLWEETPRMVSQQLSAEMFWEDMHGEARKRVVDLAAWRKAVSTGQ